MDCGITLFSGSWWAALLTWIAFAVVVTAAVTFVASRRGAVSGNPAAQPLEEIRRLSEKIEELSRRLESLERSRRS